MNPGTRRTSGAGPVYQRPDGYYVAVIELPPGPTGKRRRKQIVRKRKADAIAAQRDARAELKRTGDIRTSSPTVEVWIAEWIATGARNGRLRPRTVEGHQGHLRRYIAPSVGNVRLDKLTAAHIERLMRHMTETLGVSPTTALQTLNILKGALKAAERRDLVDRNVAKLAEPPRAAHHEAQVLTLDQAVTLLRSVWDDKAASARWSLALLAGLRQGEALGLTRQHVDLERGVIRVTWQLQRLAVAPPASSPSRNITGRLWLTRPKSQKGVREVPIVGPLRAVLERRLDEMPNDPWAFVVTAPKGGALDPSADAKAWRRALDAAGLPTVRLHDARHTTGTLLRAAGVEPRLIQVILGHNSAAMTEHYSHLGDDEARDAMDKFAALLAIEG